MSKLNGTLSLERLQEILHYDPETGIFRWKVSRKGVTVGAVAGRVTAPGYCQIKIDQTIYQSHRIAWLYMTGVWPTKLIDHINRVRSDNRFCNLREATSSENRQNTRASWGRSRYRGVTWKTRYNKWQALIMLNGKLHYLGRFDIEEDAAEAYQSARRRLHPFAPVNQTASDASSGRCKCEPELSPGLTCK